MGLVAMGLVAMELLAMGLLAMGLLAMGLLAMGLLAMELLAMELLVPVEGLLPEALQAGTPEAYRRQDREASPADPETYRGQGRRAVRQVAACPSAGNPGTRRVGLGGCNPAREVPS